MGITRANGAKHVPGDTHFAWFAPEQGFVATHWIEVLVENKLLSPAFVAAVAATDLETPIFSDKRASLLKFVPQSFTATPGEPHPDALTRDVIARLEAASPRTDSEAELLALLKAPDPVAVVRSQVAEYKGRVEQQLHIGSMVPIPPPAT